MIIVIPKTDVPTLEKDENGVIDKIRRLEFTKFSDFISMEKPYLKEYFTEIDINKLNLTKNYLYQRNINTNIKSIEDEFEVKEINIDSKIIEEEHFSKEIGIISKEENENMEFGTKVHEVFELIDFKNYNKDIIEDEFIKEKVTKFINSDLLKDIKDANIYHEYEFMYDKNNTKYHGIIDLMIEKENTIELVDFKLKNVKDEKYIKQLKGYKEYINSISNKEVNLYLYSIIDEKVEKIS